MVVQVRLLEEVAPRGGRDERGEGQEVERLVGDDAELTVRGERRLDRRDEESVQLLRRCGGRGVIATVEDELAVRLDLAFEASMPSASPGSTPPAAARPSTPT
jgi:hypothetical protein